MANMKSTRILLAEADPFRLAIYEQHIRNLGYTNIDFLSSKINDSMHQSNHGIIFMEFRIAAKNDFALLQTIKQRNPDTYIVLITSKENLVKASNALQFGAFDLVIQGKYLITSITEVLDNISMAQKRVVQHPVPSNKTDTTLYLHADGTIDNNYW
jgi:DNA-binding NtrC family response regulator